MTPPLLFGLLTPTYRRPSLLARCLEDMLRQSHPHWIAAVVHDGPGARWPSLSDPRLLFRETEARAADIGATPRLEGLRLLLERPRVPDYTLLWDDDNFFEPDALARIAAELARRRNPDWLLVPFAVGRRRLPPPDRAPDGLRLKEVDSGNLVVRTARLARALESAVRSSRRPPLDRPFDYALYLALRDEEGLHPVAADGMACVGRHDGLRSYTRLGRKWPFAQTMGYWASPERIRRSLRGLWIRGLTR